MVAQHVHRFYAACQELSAMCGTARPRRPPLQPIPVDRIFHIISVDIMELPCTTQENRYAVVFQDFLSKFPLVFSAPDITEDSQVAGGRGCASFWGPEALLSESGTNPLSYLMKEVCALLGVKKFNTTAYHPQRDGMVERFNRTLKSMLRKHAAKFSAQWDTYLHGVLWAYRNTPHKSTGEKPPFLLFGHDCRSPTEAALLPLKLQDLVDVDDYREEVVMSLSEARRMGVEAQKRYKAQYDKQVTPSKLRAGDWVFVYLPAEDMGRMRKLSRPWYGPFRQ